MRKNSLNYFIEQAIFNERDHFELRMEQAFMKFRRLKMPDHPNWEKGDRYLEAVNFTIDISHLINFDEKGFQASARKAFLILEKADRDFLFYIARMTLLFENELKELEWADKNKRKYPLSKANKVEYLLQKPSVSEEAT